MTVTNGSRKKKMGKKTRNNYHKVTKTTTEYEVILILLPNYTLSIINLGVCFTRRGFSAVFVNMANVNRISAPFKPMTKTNGPIWIIVLYLRYLNTK